MSSFDFCFYCRKEKSPQKLPKLPVKSPIKTPIKSPIRKQPEELVPPENEAEVHSPLTESPEQVVSVGAVLKNDLFCLLFLCSADKYFAHVEKYPYQ